jgi:hypothetical protein
LGRPVEWEASVIARCEAAFAEADEVQRILHEAAKRG